MAILKKAVKFIISLLLTVLLLSVLFIVGLNVAKFVIYSDYYAIESSLCKNPGLSDGFVCRVSPLLMRQGRYSFRAT